MLAPPSAEYLSPAEVEFCFRLNPMDQQRYRDRHTAKTSQTDTNQDQSKDPRPWFTRQERAEQEGNSQDNTHEEHNAAQHSSFCRGHVAICRPCCDEENSTHNTDQIQECHQH